MKNLLSIYHYIHKFYGDSLEALKVFLCFYLLKKKGEKLIFTFLGFKTKEIPYEFYVFLERHKIQQNPLKEAMNWKKVLRMFLEQKDSLLELEEFLQVITLQKTILKLYEYATPLGINELVCGLLSLQENERVYNPCCGMGSWILSLRKNVQFSLYGEDINPLLVEIARILALLKELKSSEFVISDVFVEDSKNMQKFDKVFCNPPLLSHVPLPSFKLKDFVLHSKITSEIPFFIHSLLCMQKKAVFLVRSVLLDKAIGLDFRSYLIKNHSLEMVVDLPHNLIPRQNEEFSLLVLSKNNKRVYFFDAQSFFIKEGKYNKMINVDGILDSCLFRQEGKNAKLVDYERLHLESFRASFYIEEVKEKEDEVILKTFLQSCFRGQRLQSKKDEKLLECYEIGIKEFDTYGFLQDFGESSFKPDSHKIKDLQLKEFDILLSMRGQIPKIAIMGKNIKKKCVIVNAGILVLRPKSEEIAKALYVYLHSKEGVENLGKIYKENYERVGEKQIELIRLPKNLLENAKKFDALCALGDKMREATKEIEQLLGF